MGCGAQAFLLRAQSWARLEAQGRPVSGSLGDSSEQSQAVTDTSPPRALGEAHPDHGPLRAPPPSAGSQGGPVPPLCPPPTPSETRPVGGSPWEGLGLAEAQTRGGTASSTMGGFRSACAQCGARESGGREGGELRPAQTQTRVTTRCPTPRTSDWLSGHTCSPTCFSATRGGVSSSVTVLPQPAQAPPLCQPRGVGLELGPGLLPALRPVLQLWGPPAFKGLCPSLPWRGRVLPRGHGDTGTLGTRLRRRAMIHESTGSGPGAVPSGNRLHSDKGWEPLLPAGDGDELV